MANQTFDIQAISTYILSNAWLIWDNLFVPLNLWGERHSMGCHVNLISLAFFA